MINLLFSGDFVPILTGEKIQRSYFSGWSGVFANCNLHITNLEAPLTDSGISIEKIGPSLKANPFSVKLLKEAKVNIACLANNHIFDYEEQGIQDTVKTCENNNIDTIGILSRRDGRDPWIIKTINEKRIGFLNYCEHESSVRESGLLGACGYDSVGVFNDIKYLKPLVDYLFVIYHGGNEYFPLPRPDLKKNFHYLVDIGADAVICHHSHVFSGYEFYQKKPLIYGLGNFFFPLEGEPAESQYGVVCKLIIKEEIDIEFVPFFQELPDCDNTILLGNSKKTVLDKIALLSGIITDNSALNRKWQEFVDIKSMEYLKLIPGIGFLGKVLLKAGIPLSYILSHKKTLSVFNTLRCQSHLDIARESIKRQANYE